MRKLLMLAIIFVISLSAVAIFSQSTFAEESASTANTSGGVVVQSIPGPTLAQKITERTSASWSWYIVRGSGIIAAAALIILMLSGIGLVTGHTFRILEPITAWASHRALGIVMVVSLLIHMFGLLFDRFVPFSLVTLFVPWLSNYQPATIFGLQLGSIYVALGVLAFYLTVIIVAVSLIWVEKKPYLWKITHLLSYIVIAFVFIHTLYLGTDFTHGIVRWLWIGMGVAIAVISLYRLWRSKSL